VGERRSVARVAYKREKRGLKLLSRHSLARDGGHARFRPRTPTSSGREARDGGAPHFFCGSHADGVFVLHIFLPKPAYQRLICGSGRDWRSARVALRASLALTVNRLKP
jgi:hypothetical protein